MRSFTLRYSYVHHAVVGHDVKTRALRNHIAYNRIMDENDGRSSYAIDLSNGGLAFVIGNSIQQGPEAENSGIISYGAEGYKYPVNELYVASNTIVNNRPNGAQFVAVRAGAQSAQIVNNVFSGRGELLRGPGDMRNNIEIPPPISSIRRLSTTISRRSRPPSGAASIRARPTASACGPRRNTWTRLGKRARSPSAKLDLGAFEFRP